MATASQAMTFQVDISVDFDAALEHLRDVGERMQIISDVNAEIDRARRKHGTQHDTPMGTGPDGDFLFQLDQAAARAEVYTDESEHYLLDSLSNAELEIAAKRLCADGGTGDGTGGDTWAKILFEEFTEALGADDDDLDGELVQTIAMGVSMLQAHRRQRQGKAARS